MMSLKCKECGSEIPEDAKFCPNCGAAVKPESVACKKCGAENPAGTKFCKECGSALPRKTGSSAPRQPKNTAREDTARFNNPYSYILVIALLAMVVATIYNFNLLNKERAKVKAGNVAGQNISQNAPVQQEAPAKPQINPADLEAQIQSVRAQLSANPNNAALNVEMGNLLFDSDRFAEAIPYYEKALSLEPNNADVVVDLGVSYFYMKDYPKAEQLFNRALKIDPDHINALYNLGVVALQLQKIDQLMEAWGKLMQLAPNSTQAHQATHILDQLHQNAEQEN